MELGGAELESVAFVGEDLEGVGLWIGLKTCSSCLVSRLLGEYTGVSEVGMAWPPIQ